MSERIEKYRVKYMASCQERVNEPVRAVAMLSLTGGLSRMGMMHASPLASMMMGRSAKQKAGGLPDNVMVAITDGSLHVFAYKPKGTSIKLKDEVGTWDREGLRVTTRRGTISSEVHFDWPDGTHIELGWVNIGGDFNDAAMAILGASSAT